MKKQNKFMQLPVEIVEKVEKFQKNNYLTSFTAAVIELIQAGLKAKEGK